MMSEKGFLQSLLYFDKDHIPSAVMQKAPHWHELPSPKSQGLEITVLQAASCSSLKVCSLSSRCSCRCCGAAVTTMQPRIVNIGN
eukprot:83044-Amphidinium_carterae.1